FAIFCFLFGLNRKSHRSRSPLRSLFNLQFILENKSKICQSEFIEPTFTLKNLRKRQLFLPPFANNLKKRAFLPLKAGLKVGKSGKKP
ncbi:MAG: hypothetical protein MSH66_08140, partial [Bacteroidales bacterium]|nr:hypothetical protein [Bacteroidales bacterium]